jgi:transcriptional regulator with XRE-family HTH domain
MSLGKTIGLLRKQAGLSRKELAEKVDVHQTIVGRWESGAAQPRAKSLEKMADVFGVSVEQILAGDYAGVSQALHNHDDPDLMQLILQLHKLSLQERDALKIVMKSMLARAQVAAAVAL